MNTYEILTVSISFIMALTSIVSCISSLKAKKEVISAKNDIATMIYNFNVEQNMNNNNNISNHGTNAGVMANRISGGVSIDSGKQR